MGRKCGYVSNARKNFESANNIYLQAASYCMKKPMIVLALLSIGIVSVAHATGYDQSNDFDFGNYIKDTTGIWSHDNIIWIIDNDERKAVAYNMTTMMRSEINDFETNYRMVDFWSNGKIKYVLDLDNKLHVYDANNTHILSKKLFACWLCFNDVRGIWSDGSIIYVSDRQMKKIFAYNATTLSRLTDYDFNTLTAIGNTSPSGIWSNNQTMYVVDTHDNHVYAYNMATRQHEHENDNPLYVENGYPFDLWSNGQTMWVSDRSDKKLYAYKTDDEIAQNDDILAYLSMTPRGDMAMPDAYERMPIEVVDIVYNHTGGKYEISAYVNHYGTDKQAVLNMATNAGMIDSNCNDIEPVSIGSGMSVIDGCFVTDRHVLGVFLIRTNPVFDTLGIETYQAAPIMIFKQTLDLSYLLCEKVGNDIQCERVN